MDGIHPLCVSLRTSGMPNAFYTITGHVTRVHIFEPKIERLAFIGDLCAAILAVNNAVTLWKVHSGFSGQGGAI